MTISQLEAGFGLDTPEARVARQFGVEAAYYARDILITVRVTRDSLSQDATEDAIIKTARRLLATMRGVARAAHRDAAIDKPPVIRAMAEALDETAIVRMIDDPTLLER